MDLRLGYVIIYVPDVQAAVSFYEAAFGLAAKFVHESGLYGEMETGATTLAFAQEDFVSQTCHGFERNRPGGSPAGSEIAFVTEDVAAAMAKALQAGAAPYVEPLVKPWGQTVAYIRDLNGYLIELCTAV